MLLSKTIQLEPQDGTLEMETWNYLWICLLGWIILINLIAAVTVRCKYSGDRPLYLLPVSVPNGLGKILSNVYVVQGFKLKLLRNKVRWETAQVQIACSGIPVESVQV